MALLCADMKSTRTEGSWRFLARFQEAPLAKHGRARLYKEALRCSCMELRRQSLSCVVENTRTVGCPLRKAEGTEQGHPKREMRMLQAAVMELTMTVGVQAILSQATWHCKVQCFLLSVLLCSVLSLLLAHFYFWTRDVCSMPLYFESMQLWSYGVLQSLLETT